MKISSGVNLNSITVHDWSNKCYTIHNICSGAYAVMYLLIRTLERS